MTLFTRLQRAALGATLLLLVAAGAACDGDLAGPQPPAEAAPPETAPPEALLVPPADMNATGTAPGSEAMKGLGLGLGINQCGDGVSVDGHLCYEPAAKIADTGDPLSGLVAGYIDGDADLDVAAGIIYDDQIRIKYGNGAGTFPGTHIWAMGDGPHDTEVADFDGDGRTDVISTNPDEDRVSIRWGHDGLKSRSLWSTGDRPLRVAVGDLNGDGLDDFATTNQLDGTVTVRLRQPGGGFSSATYDAPGTYDLQFGHCDYDDDLDLFYTVGAHENAQVHVRPNMGNGLFAWPTVIDMNASPADAFTGLTVGDYDEDGETDVVAVSKGSNKAFRALGQEVCHYAFPASTVVPDDPTQVYTHDFDLDGHADLITSHTFGRKFTIYLGRGNGSFTGPFVYDQAHGVNGVTSDVAVGDFNGDGVPDVVFDGTSGLYLVASNP